MSHLELTMGQKHFFGHPNWFENVFRKSRFCGILLDPVGRCWSVPRVLVWHRYGVCSRSFRRFRGLGSAKKGGLQVDSVPPEWDFEPRYTPLKVWKKPRGGCCLGFDSLTTPSFHLPIPRSVLSTPLFRLKSVRTS